jgi:hypothetical protein
LINDVNKIKYPRENFETILSFLFIAGDECTNDRFENMISNGALDGDPYGISPFQQVINNNNLKENSFFFLGKNIYDTTT